MAVDALFRDDWAASSCDATVTAVHNDGRIEVDRTCFYATSGGQPGDTGYLERASGERIVIEGTVHGETKDVILHVPAPGSAQLDVGERVTLHIDWQRRFNLMRMHTACHLLSVVCPYPITGAAVGVEESRVDFDMTGQSASKDEVTARLMELISANHPVYGVWISDEELQSNPGMVKSKNVRPPMSLGRVRLVCIGKDASIDSQPCGGTHVAQTQDVGLIHISKIEKKGKENRRFRIRFGAAEPSTA